MKWLLWRENQKKSRHFSKRLFLWIGRVHLWSRWEGQKGRVGGVWQPLIQWGQVVRRHWGGSLRQVGPSALMSFVYSEQIKTQQRFLLKPALRIKALPLWFLTQFIQSPIYSLPPHWSHCSKAPHRGGLWLSLSMRSNTPEGGLETAPFSKTRVGRQTQVLPSEWESAKNMYSITRSDYVCRMWRQCVRTSKQLSELFLLPFSVPHLGLFVFMTHPHLNQNVHLFIWVHLNCLQRRHHHASHHVLVLSPSFFHSSEKKPKLCPIIHYFSYTSGLNKDAE